MTIELSTTFWSLGVKFLCGLQTIEEEPEDDRNCRCGWKNPVHRIKRNNKKSIHIYHFNLNLS